VPPTRTWGSGSGLDGGALVAKPVHPGGSRRHGAGPWDDLDDGHPGWRGATVARATSGKLDSATAIGCAAAAWGSVGDDNESAVEPGAESLGQQIVRHGAGFGPRLGAAAGQPELHHGAGNAMTPSSQHPAD